MTVMPASAAADNRVYKKAAPSTVWFFERGSATGVLVDADKGLVLTAEHVVRNVVRAGKTDVKVMFAQTDKNGNILTEKSSYGFEKKRVLAIRGKVIYFNRLKDLAVVQLEKVPSGTQAIVLAKEAPRPGDNIHVIGNSTFFRGGLFSYSMGAVRNSYYFDQFSHGNVFFSLAHHAPTNRGDSGGPVLNDRAELVGIISQGTTGSGEGEQVIDQSVHISELRQALVASNWPVVKSLSFTCTVSLAGSVDRFYVPVRLNNALELKLQGNGKTDLDLFAFDFDSDKKNRALLAEEGLTDKERGQITPGWSGVAEVAVKNLFLKSDANRDLTFTPRNTYTLAIACPEGVRGPVCVARALPAKATDSVQVFFETGKAKARVQVRGDGDTELELAILDPAGRELGRGQGVNDRKRIAFPVIMPGMYTVRIQNSHARQYNSYVLNID
jgi:hypothetical protein